MLYHLGCRYGTSEPDLGDAQGGEGLILALSVQKRRRNLSTGLIVAVGPPSHLCCGQTLDLDAIALMLAPGLFQGEYLAAGCNDL